MLKNFLSAYILCYKQASFNFMVAVKAFSHILCSCVICLYQHYTYNSSFAAHMLYNMRYTYSKKGEVKNINKKRQLTELSTMSGKLLNHIITAIVKVMNN